MPARRPGARAYPPKEKSLPGVNEEDVVVDRTRFRYCAMCKQKHAPPTGRKCTKTRCDDSPTSSNKQESEGPQMKEMMAR